MEKIDLSLPSTPIFCASRAHEHSSRNTPKNTQRKKLKHPDAGKEPTLPLQTERGAEGDGAALKMVGLQGALPISLPAESRASKPWGGQLCAWGAPKATTSPARRCSQPQGPQHPCPFTPRNLGGLGEQGNEARGLRGTRAAMHGAV